MLQKQPLPDWSLPQVAGLITWAAVGVPMLIERWQRPVGAGFVLWLACYLSFGLLFALVTQERLEYAIHRYRYLSLTLMTLLTFGVIGFAPGYWIGGILLIIVTSYAPHVLSFLAATSWMLGQTLVMIVLFLFTGEAVGALVQAVLYLGFQGFALFTSHTALREAEARAELATLNAELRATQALLEKSSRTAERVRIARDLHDLMGHHLTALSLNLEVASHVSEGKSLEHVQKAQSLTKLLLNDVRETVSTLREDRPLDLSKALERLTQNIPDLQIHLTLPPALTLDDPHLAHVTLRCVQEVITNTLKHAHAENLWLELVQTPNSIEISAKDDGCGAKEVTAGNGLRGMSERLTSLGGNLSLTSSPGEGFTLRATLPA